MPQTPVTDLIKINTTVAGAQFAPAVCVLSGGGYIIVWEDSNSGSIYAQRFSGSGQPVGNELHLDSVQGGAAIWVSVAATAADGFVIAFQAGFDSNAEIYARRYDSLNNPVGGLFQPNTTTPNEQYNPHVTALDNGGILFTWDTRVTLGNDVVAQEVRGRIYDSSGQPVGPADFAIAPVSASARNGLSAIAPLSGGGFVVTWQTANGSGDNYEIVGQRFNGGGATVGAQFQVNTQTAGNQYGNDVARLSDGGFVVSWVDPGATGVGGRILARHYDASGSAMGGEIVVDTKGAGGYGRTVVTALANGGYVIGWIEDDGSNDNVLARAFNSNDTANGAAFEMAFDSAFNGNFFSDGAVTLPNGNVVFTWDGPSITPPGGQGTSQDVYMHVYSFSAGGGSTQPTAGPDTLTGTAGDDVLNGLGGADTMIGGAGNDTYIVDDPNDAAIEQVGQGYDVVYTSVSYTLGGGQEIEGLVVLDYAGTAPVNLTGNEFANYLLGNAGANQLSGGAGADAMEGRGGNDIYVVDNAGDVVIEAAGQGYDVVYTSVSYTLAAGQAIEGLVALDFAGTAPLSLTGNEFANYLLGNAGANQLSGGGGADAMEGRGGNDIYIVDNVGDVVVEYAGQGYDVAYTSVSYALNDAYDVEGLVALDPAGTTALNLTGNSQANYIIGNAGANVLNGGAGADTLHGGGGADTFAFTTAVGGNNVDYLDDFVHGTDKIALDDAIFGAGIGAPGSFNANAFVVGTQAGDADDRIIYNQATGQLFYDADGNGSGAAVLFANLGGAPVVSASDFVVI